MYTFELRVSTENRIIYDIQKGGDQSDRRDAISEERVVVILSYRIIYIYLYNDKQKIKSRGTLFLWVIVEPVDTNLDRFGVEMVRLRAQKAPKMFSMSIHLRACFIFINGKFVLRASEVYGLYTGCLLENKILLKISV